MLLFLLRVCSKNETYFALSLTIHFLAHFTHALATKHNGICIPATTPLPMPWLAPWVLPLPLLQPCHTTATVQHSNNATLITRAIIATAETMQMVGCCVFTCLLAHFLLTVLPLLTQTHAFSPPHRHNERPQLPSSREKNSKERSNSEFFIYNPPYIKYFTI